ncbi:MAG: diguanylate cyclase, partial [Alphaproteobacteria bacterium]|nr:diguanylate cyclase [Alphaproteobacteria bacterium]
MSVFRAGLLAGRGGVAVARLPRDSRAPIAAAAGEGADAAAAGGTAVSRAGKKFRTFSRSSNLYGGRNKHREGHSRPGRTAINVSGGLVFERIVNEANDAVMVAEINPETGPGFRIIYTNAAFSRIFGYAADEVVGRSPRLLQGPETCADTIREISAVVHGGSSIRRRILNYNKAGRPVWVDVNIVPLPGFDGEIRRFAAIERDVTNEVRHEAQLEQLAYVDPLTKLANRRYFEQTLQRELSRAQRLHLPLSLAILDIDHFKQVNDRWGHPIGDRVIHGVAQSLLKSVRAYDCIARIGGEEFTVLLPGADLDAGKRVID